MNKLIFICSFLLALSCNKKEKPLIDILILNGTIIDGTGAKPIKQDVGLWNDKIVFIGDANHYNVEGAIEIDATGLIVSPGFIDPHTHSWGDLKDAKTSMNENYLFQGVTTVFNGNDGEGPYDLLDTANKLQSKLGTNTAFFIGHGTVRKAVLGDEDVEPTLEELDEMRNLVKRGMEQGAFGLSTGLYYAPGSFATTEEIIELTKVIQSYSGIYDTHLRDESSYNIGLLNAVKETIRIGEEADVAVNFGHIKALGVDVWGESEAVISLIEEAQTNGQIITADQYPWRASGTHLDNALIDRWVMAGGEDAFQTRISDSKQLPKIKEGIIENLRKRGGPASILITADSKDQAMIGKNLQELAAERDKDVIELVLDICRNGGARIASFNMNANDVENFMQQPWVMTSSDGTKGHPRKYASYPEKYAVYVKEKNLLSLEEFVYKSSGLVAESFGIQKRGKLLEGYFADIVIFNADDYKPKANFSSPEELTDGVEYVFVNGGAIIYEGEIKGINSARGRLLVKNKQ